MGLLFSMRYVLIHPCIHYSLHSTIPIHASPKYSCICTTMEVHVHTACSSYKKLYIQYTTKTFYVCLICVGYMVHTLQSGITCRSRHTIYQLKNIIQRRNAVSDPKHNFNAYSDFLNIILDARITMAAATL